MMTNASSASSSAAIASHSQRLSLKRLHQAMDGFIAQLQCAICLCSYSKPASLPCHHCFCEECIHRALELKPVCPICKMPAKKRKLRYDTMLQQLLVATDMWSTAASTSSMIELINVEPLKQQTASESSTRESNGIRINPLIAIQPETTPIKPPVASPSQSTRISTEPSMAPTFIIGQLVDVVERTWVGVNKPGGAAWITGVNEDGTYNVKYIIGTRKENNIPEMYILVPHEHLGSFTTPSGSVKHYRRKRQCTPPSMDLLAPMGSTLVLHDLVFLFSGFSEESMKQFRGWCEQLGAHVVSQWDSSVTHLIAKCATLKEVAECCGDEDMSFLQVKPSPSSRKRALFTEDGNEWETKANQLCKRWVKLRSLKYLKALVAGRWIVGEEWLRACYKHKKRMNELHYEVDGHVKGMDIHDACRRARILRDTHLSRLSTRLAPETIGTQLFTGYCFHLYGEFLAPMPPPVELDALIRVGDGKVIRFLDDIVGELATEAHQDDPLIIVCDKLNPQMLKRTKKQVMLLPQLQFIAKDRIHVVSYQWLLHSISEVKIRTFTF